MSSLRLATFVSDATPPLASPLLGSGCERAAVLTDPLQVRGLVFLPAGQEPVVLACVDWLGIGNASHRAWRQALARAAGTCPQRVMLSTLHQHTAPMIDLSAHRLLEEAPPLPVPLLDEGEHDRVIAAAAAALGQSLPGVREVTHLGVGDAVVYNVASTRRLVGPDGRLAVNRWSRTSSQPEQRLLPEGCIDPLLTTVSWWAEGQPLAALSCYATHPMSRYGGGEVTWDFVGMARASRERELPGVVQVYATGCGGDLAPGKYNDGSLVDRNALAERMTDAMRRAWANTGLTPLRDLHFTRLPLPLEPRVTADLNDQAMRRLMHDPAADGYERVRAAYYLAWRQEHAEGHRLDLPVLDFGAAVIGLLPGEPFVAYQLAARDLRPADAVLLLGYGDYAPVYLPTAAAYSQGGYEPGPWCFVGPQCEAVILQTLLMALPRP